MIKCLLHRNKDQATGHKKAATASGLCCGGRLTDSPVLCVAVRSIIMKGPFAALSVTITPPITGTTIKAFGSFGEFLFRPHFFTIRYIGRKCPAGDTLPGRGKKKWRSLFLAECRAFWRGPGI